MFYEKTYKDKLASMYPNVVVRYEVPFEGVRADAVIFTDPVTAFEIKSEKDDLSRLKNQVDKYFRVFTRVIVLAHESKASGIVKLLEETDAGIWLMNDDQEIKICVEGKVNDTYISPEAVYGILRKPEREVILRRHFGYLPPVSDFRYYRDRLEYFKNIPKEEMLSDLKEALIARYSAEDGISTIHGMGNFVVNLLKSKMEEK